ncbi:PIN domain-containing protein [Phaeodactylibacter xiamenensis]|jgi:predicted nucleic acid-binding protein
MILLFDTNLILDFLRDGAITAAIDEQFNLSAASGILAISVVSIGELNALALKRNWGPKRVESIYHELNKFLVIPINSKDVLRLYGEIDAFSQGKLKGQPLPAGLSSRNMGKNDLWIAASAAATGATLLTTDKDFKHLKGVFIKHQYYAPQDYL